MSESTETDAKVAAFVVRDFRANGVKWYLSEAEKHLGDCSSTRVVSYDGSDGTYGCDTGCEYATLEAELMCDHGYLANHTYGEFGDIAGVLDEIMAREEA